MYEGINPRDLSDAGLLAAFDECFEKYWEVSKSFGDAFSKSLSGLAEQRAEGLHRLGELEATKSGLEASLDFYEVELIARGIDFKPWRDHISERFHRNPARS